ncbi:OmpC family outer membrane porin [Burkholderia gladioli BSR3]|uniref:OmpC family outer membrane porin n=2 Tax=Burkholderia gladioli TaxID=28095 RepID=F2LQU9_BURGS|nr:OmpC family outer membrane porin [Burkholderia gladioli BSR3]
MEVTMKRTYVALCGTTLLCASHAYAQSSVALYGIIDEGVQFISNNKNVVNGHNVGGRQFNLDSTNGINGSRWGLRGSEDLGGGLAAIFTLESGVNLNNGQLGQGGAEFGRQAFVGLSSSRFGAVTLGRQYDSVFYFVQPVSTMGYYGSALFSHPGDLDNLNNSLRLNNTIRYTSPKYRGFSFGGEWSLGGQPGNITGGSGYNAGLTYANGPITIAAAYEYFKNPTGTAGSTGFFTGNPNGATQLSGVLNSGYASASSYQVITGGATYQIGNVLIGAAYSNVAYGNITALGGNTAKFNTGEIGIKYKFSPTFYAGIGYAYTKGSAVGNGAGGSVGNQHFNQLGLIADYFVSKRTDFYAGATLQKASGISSTGAAAVANIGNLGDSSNTRQAYVRFAIRTRF